MKNIRFSHHVKTGGTSVVQGLRIKYPETRHSHNILCTKEQAISQKIDHSFATVGNPYVIFRDIYNYFKVINGRYTLNEFIENLEKDTVDKSINKLFYNHQHLYVQNATYKVNGLIRLESFEEGWKKQLNDILGIDTPMIHANKTEDIKAKSLTKKQKEFVFDYYKEDFLLLGYDK